MKMAIIKLMEKNGNWWKGSFPTWIVALLIGTIGFFLQRELRMNFDCREKAQQSIASLEVKVEALKIRITVLEETVRENHVLLTDIGRRMNVPRRP